MVSPTRRSPFGKTAILSVLPLALAACSGEIGEPLGQEGAHEHGVADVSMVVEGASATVVFTAPSGDLWGFEHAPENAEDRELRSEALSLLERSLVQALGLDVDLGCQVTSVEWSGAAAPLEDEAEPGEDGHEHEDDDHEHEEDGDEHEDHGGSDAVGAFDLTCERPLAGSSLSLAFSEIFEALDRIDLQVVSEERQLGRRVPAQGTEIEL